MISKYLTWLVRGRLAALLADVFYLPRPQLADNTVCPRTYRLLHYSTAVLDVYLPSL